MLYEQTFLFSLFLTLAIEIPVVLFILRFLRKDKIKITKLIFVAFLASALTLPYFWFILPFYLPAGKIYVFLGETLIIIVEAIVYQQLLELKWTKALALSLIANSASALGGLFINS